MIAVARDDRGKKLATAHLTGGDPYSFTAPILAWAARKAAAEGVRPAGALGLVEAFGPGSLESGWHTAQPARSTGAGQSPRSPDRRACGNKGFTERGATVQNRAPGPGLGEQPRAVQDREMVTDRAGGEPEAAG